MKLYTPACVHCGHTGEIDVPEKEGEAYLSGIGHIQDAMPTTPAPIREQLMTGMHPKCWDVVMSDVSDADDCGSCGEDMPEHECKGSKRPCGHHCNHSWTHDECCWCHVTFGENGVETWPTKT